MLALAIGAVLAGLLCAGSSEVVLGDFMRPDHGWRAALHVADAVVTAKGLSFAVTGGDPQFVSPPLTFPDIPPDAKRLRFTVECEPTRCKEEWQLFYAFSGRGFSQVDAVMLRPEGDAPHRHFSAEVPVAFFTTGRGIFRLDPPGGAERFTLKSLSVGFLAPMWSYKPAAANELELPADASVLEGDGWRLRYDPRRMGAFRYESHGKTVEGNPCEPCVVVPSQRYKDRQPYQIHWTEVKPSLRHTTNGFVMTAATQDGEGRKWRMTRSFAKAENGRALAIRTKYDCDKIRVLHVPYLTLFADRESGGRKHQAMLAGIEYLDDEPSSSTKDIRTSESNRLIPSAHRFSAPFAVLTDAKSWLAAEWDAPRTPRPHDYSVVFDSPDRQFRSGGHLLAFWFPTVGTARHESELDLYDSVPYSGGTQTVILRAGNGANVAHALAALVRRDNLPPSDRIDENAALRLLAHGWLDSQIRDGMKVRHAIYGSERFKWASDAPALMRWMAGEIERRPNPDSEIVKRLRETAAAMFAAMPPNMIGFDGVSHVQWPVAILLAGNMEAWLYASSERLHKLNGTLADGVRVWRKPQNGGRNLGETLDGDDCNGYTASAMAQLLSDATWSGNEAEIARALSALDKMLARYDGTVPRGAQPWEMPLHTPDIVASARMVKCCALGYLLQPDKKYLKAARYWAYTGLSMVYLVPPPFSYPEGAEPFGRYATCGVMGATWWARPNWIGRPVQWCGLVYAAALYEYARLCSADEADFWRTVADGIVASGIRQSHTEDEPALQGLLPDSVDLERQTRYPVPINPGTLQENMTEMLRSPYHTLCAFPGDKPVLLRIAGGAAGLTRKGNVLSCQIKAWPETESRLVLTRIDAPVSVTLDGKLLKYTHDAARRVAIVTIPSYAQGTLRIGANKR